MLVDNLKDINSQADLFQYICNLESELEQVREFNNKLREMNSKLNDRIIELQKELQSTETTLEFYTNKLAIKQEIEND